MRFHGAVEAYGWYRCRRFELARPGALPRHLYHARAAAETAIALADLGRLLSRLGRAGRKALRERGSEFPAALARFESLLREADYLH
jgi:hypothetical protein